MDKHDRFLAINQTLPGLEDFLKVVLGGEPLSEEANRQRIEFLRRLESVSRPPSLPPRPANLSEIYRARLQQNESPSGGGLQDESSVYKNDKTVDPVQFASQQRELSRFAALYKTYAPQTVIIDEKGNRNGDLYFARPGNTRDGIRDSIQSTSSAEDDLYEHLSLKSVSPSDPVSSQDGNGSTKTEDSFVFPSPPKTPQEHSSIYIPTRTGSLRASGGKGRLSTGWFKREAKLNEEVYVSHLREPVIKGYLKDIKANKRRWCVLQGNRLHIFKNQEDPAIMILYLPECNIGVDDKKKISYSFRLIPADGPGVTLAIEDGQDLSPWMSAIMAAAVRRSSIDRPVSPLEGLFTLEQARAEKIRGSELDGGIEEENEEQEEDIYEKPSDHSVCGMPSAHSTPVTTESKEEEEDEGYDAPLPPLPIDDDDSSSESSSDEDESMEKKVSVEKAAVKKKIYDQIPPDLLAELTAGQHKGGNETNKSQDSICDEGSTNDHSLDITDSHSEHSGNISNRHSYIEPIASDDTVSSEPKEENVENVSRKRTSTVLSISMESVCSDTEHPRTSSVTSDTSVSSKGLGPKVKRRRKLVPAEAELQFLQDPSAMHSGILYQKRRLGVWSKRYCKIIDSRFKCYRNPADQKPGLNFPILGYDISLIDNKESRKSYCIKISHPSLETYYFATDSRVSIERWIEVLSLAATGRLDVIAPYPPYFCAEQSGDELKSQSRESLLSSEGRLSDDDSADTLDELDPPSEKGQSLNRLQANEEQECLPAEKTNAVLPGESRNVEVSVQTQGKCQEGGAEQSPETGKKERTQKKRKEKPREGTKTPSTMSPPHSMFISESVDGQAKPEPMNEEYASRPQGSAKESSEESSPKKDKRWTDTLKKKRLSRGHSYDYRLRGNVTPFTHPDNAKNKHPSMRRKNSQTITNLTNLFDREGRFCGYLTEVRFNKFGTTHLRRWCVVKNGLLILFNSEREDTPQAQLSLVDMWLTDKSEESRNKFCFMLEDKDGNETTLQTTVEEDFQKWMGILELFTELRVERPQREVAAEPHSKTDSSASDLGDGSFERGTLRTMSSRAAAKIKDEIYALAPGKVRTSLRMKLSQRRNVIDLFRKTHSSYDLEAGAPPEGSSLPEADVDTLAVFGGNLTQVESNGSTNSRWCTIRQKELMIFPDRKASDPLRKIPLLRSAFSDLSDDESSPNRFEIRFCNETLVFDACDKFDHNRWLRMLASEIERRNSSDDDRPKCVGRLTSPTFTKKKILHRKTRSETLSQEEETPTSATKTRENSTSSTDRLMSGYLQEVRETHGARTLLRRWCVATSEKFIVYENQNSKKASFEWELSQMTVQDQSDMDAGSFGFRVFLGQEKLCFKVIDEDSARHWLSVLARYCHSVAASEPLRSNIKEDRRRSASDNDLKSKSAEKDLDVLEVLSEGRASGRKLMRRATEDSTFFRKFNRSELFKAPWRTSTDKLEVKMRDRERSGRAAANKASKRFSCGSLFDSDGKYSGHLMELITHELYSSQVRRWCVQKDDSLYIYENEAADDPIKVVPLCNAKVVDNSDVEGCIYRFRVDYGEGKAVFFRALTRTDLEKWTTVISVKTAVLLDRSERQLRRSRTLSSEKSSSESEVTSPDHRPNRSLTADSGSYNETVSIWSGDSVFDPANDPCSVGLKPVDPDDETINHQPSPVEQKDEQSPNDRCEDLPSAERTVSEAEISDSSRKTVSSLSSIEDLSRVYENFLAFASAMAERSPEFQEQLYHAYENVTQALDRGDLGSSQYEGQITEELPEEVRQGTEEGNDLGSPSLEMSSEFEKISLRENEEKDNSYEYRYSGIHGESELEKVVEDANGNEQCVMDAATEDEKSIQTEVNQDGVMASGGFKGETESTAVESVSRGAEELVEGPDSNGSDEGLMDENAINESEQETVTSKNKNDIEEIQDIGNDPRCINVEDSINTSDELQSETGETMNETTTGESSLQHESVREDSSSSPVVHVDHSSAIETGESSLYLVEQVSDQVWREIDSEQFSEPVVETSDLLDAVRVSTPYYNNDSESPLLERHCLASAVDKTASNEDDESRTSNLEGQDSTNAPDCTGNDFNVENDDERLNNLVVSETEPQCFSAAEEELQDGKLDIEGGKTWNNADGILEATENVCVAESFESSLQVTLKCSKEAEVRTEQTLASEVYVSEHAQIWEEALTRVDESPSSTTQNFELESHALLESPSSDLEIGDFTSAQGSPEPGEPSEMCNDSNQEHPSLNNVDQPLSSSLHSQTNLEDCSPETGIDSDGVVEAFSETVSNFPEERCAEINQLEQTPSTALAFSNEHAENVQSTEVYSKDSLGNEPVENNSTFQQDIEEPGDVLDEGIELEKRCSSSEGYYTPEDTIELLVRSDSIAEEQTETNCASSRTQNSNPELGCTRDETKPTDLESVLQSEKENVATSCLEQNDHEFTRELETDSTNSESQPPSAWSGHDSSLTRSQMDILRAVTAAFEEILELHGDDSDSDDTRL